jgi:hypothetical protein
MDHRDVFKGSIAKFREARDFMPITPTNPFKGRQYPGELILLCVRWYLRYPLAYEHVAEILVEPGIAVDASFGSKRMRQS